MSRRLVGVEIQGSPLDLNETFWPVRRGTAVIGSVNSAVYSPRLKRNIGYAMVPVADATPGTHLEVETPLGSAAATVVATPFVDPNKDIPRS